MMPESTVELLRGYGNGSLQQMARERGEDTKGKNKQTLVQMLAATLEDPDRIRRALADLAPVERSALDHLVLAGGEMPTDVLRRLLEREGRVTPQVRGRSGSYQVEKGSPWARGSDRFENVVARLGVLGLAFTTGRSSGGAIAELSAPGRRLVIPPEVLRQLPRVTMPAETTAEPPEVAAADSSLLLRDAYSLLSLAERTSIPLTVRGLIMKRALVQIDQSLTMPEDAAGVRSEEELDRLPLLRAVLEELSLLVSRPGRLAPGEGIEGFLFRPPGERLALLYDAYRRTPRWCEVFHVPLLSVSSKGAHPAPPRAIAARQRVLQELAELPVGEWIPVAHLVERLRHRAYEFLISRQVAPTGFSSYSGYVYNPYAGGNGLEWEFGPIHDEEQGWEKVEAGFIRVMVEQPLHWLGVVDLGLFEGKPTTFRITSDGARLVRGEPLSMAELPPRVVVQPNFQVFAFPPTSEAVLLRLDRMADRVRAEQVVEYRLTRESVYRAQREGVDVVAIIAFLEEVSGAPLPQNVRRTLEEWGQQHERITVHRAAPLLQTADEAALDALYADPELGRLVGRRLGPTTALVPLANLAVLPQALLASGRLPALTEGKDASGLPHLSVDPAGAINFRHRVPSIHVLGALRPLVDGEQDGAPRLTPASLRRAVGQGMDADRIIAILERWHAGPLSPEVQATVRCWAKKWGRGALVEAVLLQVESPEVLADLLADPEVHPHLRPVPGADRLAVVQREGLAQVRSALEGRGMALEERLLP